MSPPPPEDLYSQLTPSVRGLAERGVVRRYPKKAVLINEGEAGDSLFVLLRGSVKVFAMDENGREITYGKVVAGDYFGEMSLDGGVRSASVITVDASICAVVSRQSVTEHLVAEPAFAMDLVSHVIARARAATEAAKSMALLDVYSRLVGVLEEGLSTAQQAQPKAESRQGFYLAPLLTEPVTLEPITHQDIASRIGASREMISRILKDLERGGYIDMSPKRIVLLKKLPARW